jgi:hypothetical protein
MGMCLHDSTLWFPTSKLHYHKLIAHVNNSQWGSSEHMHANVLARFNMFSDESDVGMACKIDTKFMIW